MKSQKQIVALQTCLLIVQFGLLLVQIFEKINLMIPIVLIAIVNTVLAKMSKDIL